MGSGTQRQEQTTTQNLPANQQLNIDMLLRGALDYFQSGGRQFFPGDTVADFDPLQVQGQNSLVNFAGGAGQNLIDQSIEANSFFTDPNNILNPSNIPGFQGVTDDITRQFTDNLTRNILPSVRGGGTASGQFGGSASGIGQALAVSESNQGLTDSLANLNLGAYAQGLDSFNQALNRAPGLFQLGTQPGQVTSAVGDVRQGQAQAEIGGERERFSFDQNEPLNILQVLRDLTGSAGQFGGSVDSTSSQTTSGGGLAQGIGALLTGASLLGTGGASGVAKGAGAGAGGIGGAGSILGGIFQPRL